MSLRQRLMAATYDRLMRGYERHAGPRRSALFEGVRGRVVELGPGTGVNLGHLPADVDWYGVEPSRPMRAMLSERWREVRGGEAPLVEVEDGHIYLPEAFADVVVCSLVLCSVADQARTLGEVRRILRPGGRFVFLEHVAAPPGTWTRRLQGLGTPLWRHIADGCRLDRDTGAAIHAAGFERVELEEYRMPREAAPGFASWHVSGIALR